MSAGMRDNFGNPIAVETYEYSPREILSGRTIEMYTEYMIYCMEFKMVIIEQLSELAERKYLEGCNYNPPELVNGYGVIYQVTILRDMYGMSMEFMSADSKALFKVSLDIAQANYPELLYKSHLVNTSWIFSTIWYFVKGLLDARTAEKVTTSSTDFKKTLVKEITVDNIPSFMGGNYDFKKEPDFEFDISELGPLHLFAYDGSKPSCYLEHMKMIGGNAKEKLDTIPVTSSLDTISLAADEPPPPGPTGPVAVHGILADSSAAGFEHSRRRSLSTNEPSRPEAVILDLDGTLLDTETLSDSAIKKILENLDRNSVEFNEELRMQIMGLPDKAWTELVVSTLKLEDVLSPSDLLMQWQNEMENTMGNVRLSSCSCKNTID